MKRWIALASAAVLLALVVVIWTTLARPRPVAFTPTLTGELEYCLTCHGDLAEISPSHPVESFGCVLCHGGERLALDADLAHSTMRGGRNPADLAFAAESCGGTSCHTGEAADERNHVQRVLSSVQATYAGAIAQIRFTYGAQPDLHARLGIYAIQAPEGPNPDGPTALGEFEPSPEDPPPVLAFAENCLNCHMTAEALPGNDYARLTGCVACHTPTAGADLETERHRLTTAIPYTQCNTCHNRGNYDLRGMQFVPRTDHPTDRKSDYYQPIAQFTLCEYELDCVDCHTRYEAMGDGHLYNNQAEIQYVQCRTCHGTLEELPLTETIDDPEALALRMAFLNPVTDLQTGDTIVVTERGEPMWNVVQQPDGSLEMVSKVTQIRYPVPLVKGSACEQDINEQESRTCHECHAVEKE